MPVLVSPISYKLRSWSLKGPKNRHMYQLRVPGRTGPRIEAKELDQGRHISYSVKPSPWMSTQRYLSMELSLIRTIQG